MTPALPMKVLLLIPLLLLAAIVASVAYVADQMFGVVAFTYRYLAFCMIAALALGGIWHACFRKFASAFTLAVFVILASNFIIPPPSERLLRAAMIKTHPGTDASPIVGIVKD